MNQLTNPLITSIIFSSQDSLMFKDFFLSEKNMIYAILASGIIIFFLYFPEFHEVPVLTYLDNFFVVLFVIEAIVKIRTFKLKGYFSSNWNKFDFAIVVLSLPSLIALFLPLPFHTEFLKILRLFRLIRLIRFISFIPHMNSIVAGLGRALKASVFVILALFFLNFMLALITCHFYGHLVPEYFRDPLISSYTIFQLFTVEGWNEIPALIAERTDSPVLSAISRFYFVIVVLMGGIFGMSLANAVFVDEMTIDNNQVLEEKIDRLEEKIEALTGMIQKSQTSKKD